MPSSRPKSAKPRAAPIDLDEIEHDPGFRGMLSFLEVSPEEKRRQLALRDKAERQPPMGELPTGQSPMGQSPMAQQPIGDKLMGQPPIGQPPMGESEPDAIPSMEVEGRGRRPLRYCRTVQDGHTTTEEMSYQALWAYARRHGKTDPDGSQVVDLALSQLRTVLNTDHKNIKRLVTALRSKLALEVVRPPDYRRAISTRYRIFSPAQILERRKASAMVWVVRTRAVRFVPIEVVNQLLIQRPMGN